MLNFLSQQCYRSIGGKMRILIGAGLLQDYLRSSQIYLVFLNCYHCKRLIICVCVGGGGSLLYFVKIFDFTLNYSINVCVCNAQINAAEYDIITLPDLKI